MAAGRVIKLRILGDSKHAEGALGKLGGKLGKLGVAAAAAGAAAVAVGAGAVKLGAAFDEAYDKIRVGTGATGGDLDKLKDSFRNVVKSVPTDFGKASTAIADLNTRTGLTGKPLEKLSKQMLEMTRLTGGDLSSNIASVTRVFGDWSISTDKQSDTMDYLFRVSQSTGIGIDSLSTKVVQFGAPLRQLGFDFETSAAMLGKWEKEGVNTEAVLAGMKVGLGKLSKAGKEPVKALADVSKAIKGAGTAGEANRIAIETFGQRAGPDMAAAIREGRFDLDELVASLKASPETIMGAAKSTQSFSERWQVFRNKVLVGLEPLATKAFTAVGDGMDRLSRWWDRHGEKVKAGFDRVRDAMVELGRKVKAGAELIIRNWDAIKSTATVAAAVLSPLFVLLGLHFAALGTAATVSAAKQAAAWVMTSGAAAKAAVAHGVAVAGMIAKWAALGVAAMVNGAKIAAGWLLALGPIGLGIVAFGAIAAAMVVAWKKSETFRNIVKAALGGALAAVHGFLGGIQKMLEALGRIPGFGWADTAAQKVAGARKSIDGLRDSLSRVPGEKRAKLVADVHGRDRVGALRQEIAALRDRRVTVTTVHRTVRTAERDGRGGGLQERAHGGPILRGMPYLVGERGPELVVPNRSGQVVPARATRDLLHDDDRRSGGPVIGELHVHGLATGSPNDVAREVVWQLKTRAR